MLVVSENKKFKQILHSAHFPGTAFWPARVPREWLRLQISGWLGTFTGQIITGRAERPCCQLNGCRQKPFSMGSSRQKQMYGTWAVSWKLMVKNTQYSIDKPIQACFHTILEHRLVYVTVSTPPGHLGSCCGRWCPWATCLTPAEQTRRWCNSWPTAEGQCLHIVMQPLNSCLVLELRASGLAFEKK